MKRIEADFMQPRQPTRLMWSVALVLALAALSACVALATAGEELESLKKDIDARRAAAALELDIRPIAPAWPAYGDSANQLLSDRAVPWPEVLRALEATTVPSVAVVSIVRGANDMFVAIEVKAMEHAQVLVFADSLGAGQAAPGGLTFNLLRDHAVAGESSVTALILASR